MGRYSSYQREKAQARRGEVHPVMRGIGCVLFALVPILSYGVAILLVNYGVNKGWPLPQDWLGTPTIHPLLLKLTGLSMIFDFLRQQTNLIANLVFAVGIAVLIFGVLSIIYGYMFKLMGPPEYGPTDVPPVRVKTKKYKR